MKSNKKILSAIFLIVLYIAFSNVSYAGEQRLNSLDYQATLNSDGSMDVVETWDIYISETNTLFKNFNLDSEKYSDITDVKVKDLTNHIDLSQINVEMYHVTRDCYYALPISGNKFEIAWGVGLDNSSATRKYQISYTVEDAVTVYKDCSELYWQFVGETNAVPVKKVTGIIKLPKSVSNIEKLRVWAHGPLNGEIQKESKDTVVFEVDDLDSKTMLEVRVVTEEPIFKDATKLVSSNRLNFIIEEETEWAEEANRQRMITRIVLIVVGVVGGAIYIAILVFFGKKISKYRRKYKELKDNFKETIDIGEYFRDIPREKDSTPAEAAFLYYSKNNKFDFSNEESKVFSATLLNLCLKKVISFEKEGSKDIKINLSYSSIADLKPSEKNILELLMEIAGESAGSVTISQIKKFANRYYEKFGNAMSKLDSQAKQSHIDIENYNKEIEKEVENYTAKKIVFIVLIIMLVGFSFFSLPIIIEFIICAIYLGKISKTLQILTEQGEIERRQWKGLEKYMEDFSMLNERDIPDLVLWEKYLVYATAFGISDKVIKQLKVVYPEINNLNSNNYSYLYIMGDSRFENGLVSQLNHGIDSAYKSYRSAYNIAHSSSSSGSGGGGGFSGGGGGRWWRWPEWEAVRINIGSML